jgi:hypothetical protein
MPDAEAGGIARISGALHDLKKAIQFQAKKPKK